MTHTVAKVSCGFLFLIFNSSFNLKASEDIHSVNTLKSKVTEVHNEEAESYNPNPGIMKHISDANEIHLYGDVIFPLPVFLYDTKTKSFTKTMSSSFHHGYTAIDGYVLDHGKVKKVQDPNFPMGEVPINVEAHKTSSETHYSYLYNNKQLSLNRSGFIDLSITKNVFFMLVAAMIMILLFIIDARKYKTIEGKAPSGLQNFLEPLIEFVRDDIAKPNLGAKTDKFMPYLLTVFFFIWICNLLGLIPFIGNPNITGNIAVTMALALITFLIVNINGTKTYWSHLFDPLGSSMPWIVKIPLYIILVPIELIGVLTKPFALMIRLFANITAGHIIVLSLISLIFVFGHAGQSVSGSTVGAFIAVPFVMFISLIELLVAFIQAFVFTILSAVFISLAVEDNH